MDQELREMLHEIRTDVKELLPLKQDVARHEQLLYGNGQQGLLTTVEQLKTKHKFYDKLLSGIGAILAFVTGNAIWRLMGGKV